MDNSILTHDPFNVKNALDTFREEFKDIRNEGLVNTFISILKKVIFFNLTIKESNLHNTRYFNSIIYDALNAIISICKGNERYCYFDIRSLIENSLRVSLRLEDNDEMSVTSLFYRFNESGLGNYQLIKNYYSLACDYVHNNSRADLPVTSSYVELKNSHSSEERMLQRSRDLLQLISEITYIVLVVYNDEVNHIFYRKSTSLKFLVSERIYKRISELDNLKQEA
ncbi:MAG TPA: hypothetical protein DEF42_03605 [Desulfosporosinus sp.]|nr:hypothetical protein [Desulfosporosinus sp.]